MYDLFGVWGAWQCSYDLCLHCVSIAGVVFAKNRRALQSGTPGRGLLGDEQSFVLRRTRTNSSIGALAHNISFTVPVPSTLCQPQNSLGARLCSSQSPTHPANTTEQSNSQRHRWISKTLQAPGRGSHTHTHTMLNHAVFLVRK